MCASLRCHILTSFSGRRSAAGTCLCLFCFLLGVWLDAWPVASVVMVVAAVTVSTVMVEAAVAMTIVSTIYRLLKRCPRMIAPDNGSEIMYLLFPNVAAKPAMSSMLMESRELWNDGVYRASAWELYILDDPVWWELVELWQVTVRQARAETTQVPENSPFRNQALQTSGPRQHPTPASSGQHPRPRPPLAPGDARFGPEPPRPSDSAGFGMESPRSNPSPSNEGSPKNRSIIGGPSPCLLVPISFSRHGKDLPLEPPPSFRAPPPPPFAIAAPVAICYHCPRCRSMSRLLAYGLL